ncbi:SDR family NAD(P)-dependent oxidoreductase [Sulfurovum sp. TSL1]|uniref:SDR family NAD(P)-dependent oxidoreductase n=1 Tax=Sulfurovum sp. TSL1 TaxID=2826994 RepID=UPI001CC484F2|nr:SDR family NAD(P)-dependent oxidoreductase [Sulfurovum sp. TSL1]GIT99278.1 alcohol dehydrogenase [Sulfurovum sp. TSL1]
MKNVLITGVSSGLGEALAEKYLKNGDSVYAIGRTLSKKLDHYPHFFFFPYDLSDTFMIQSTLKEFLQHRSFDMVILNAGVLGDIKALSQTDLMDAKEVMEINVWANKELIDTLHAHAQVKQIVGISSGAAVNGSKGWGAYALSKAGLNMLLSVYAKELPEIHFTALAPGVIRTPMVEHIIEEVDDTLFPSAKRLKENPIQTAEEAAENLIATFPKLLAYESGSFLDVRTM